MHEQLINILFKNYSDHGFVTEDNIFETIQKYSVPLFDTEYICEQLLSRGVIIRDDDVSDEDSGEEAYDKTQTDYESVFNDVLFIDSSLRYLIDFIKPIQPPQRREWQNLLPQAQRGNTYARNRVFEMYMRNVIKLSLVLSKKYSLPLADTIQDGMTGLHISIDKFEFGKQDLFTTYFPFWVKQIIIRNASTRNPTIYFPVHVKDKIFSLYDLLDNHICESCDRHVFCPELVNSVATLLECDTEEAISYINYSYVLESIEDLLITDENCFNDDGMFFNAMEDKVMYEQLCNDFDDIFSKLKPKEAEIIKFRYGLDGNPPKTLEELGSIYNVTRERIRQIEAKVIRKIRSANKAKILRDYY